MDSSLFPPHLFYVKEESSIEQTLHLPHPEEHIDVAETLASFVLDIGQPDDQEKEKSSAERADIVKLISWIRNACNRLPFTIATKSILKNVAMQFFASSTSEALPCDLPL